MFKLNNMILQLLLNVEQDVEESLTLIVLQNIKKFVKKYFKKKENNLMFRNKES